jgi:hypothetical protein
MVKRGLGLVLAVALVVILIPTTSAEEHDGEADEPRCITPPEVEVSYKWAYELSNQRTRYVTVHEKETSATTPRGQHNVTKLEFAEQDVDGNVRAWGETIRYSAESPYLWGLVSQDRWEKTEKGELRRLDNYDPPFRIIHHAEETCPGEFWRFETDHSVTYGKYGRSGQEQATETWQVRALRWTNITVPAGTHEVLPITAVRENDEHRITTYWSPEAEAPARVEQIAPGDAEDQHRELVNYILDQRPTPIFQILPEHPEVGDTITLNASASYDPDGNITEYRWIVDGEEMTGSVQRFNATEEGTMRVQLYVTDDADRTDTLTGTRYIAPEDGSGVGVTGPTRAYSGQYVTLEAHPSFDPVEIRWREGSEIVGEGDTFQFRMEEARNLTVDAFHESGRVFTANHSVELVERSEAGSDEDTQGGADYPPGGSDELAILEPLEGQVVPTRFEVTVRAKSDATLTASQRPVWQGTAGTRETVTIEELEPGDHTLRLESSSANQTVNVTVAEGGTHGAGGSSTGNSSSAATDGAPVPAAGLAATLVGLASTAIAARARR